MRQPKAGNPRTHEALVRRVGQNCIRGCGRSSQCWRIPGASSVSASCRARRSRRGAAWQAGCCGAGGTTACRAARVSHRRPLQAYRQGDHRIGIPLLRQPAGLGGEQARGVALQQLAQGAHLAAPKVPAGNLQPGSVGARTGAAAVLAGGLKPARSAAVRRPQCQQAGEREAVPNSCTERQPC